MPLDDTNWPAASAGAPAEDIQSAGQRQQAAPAEDMRLADRDQQAAPAGSVGVVPAENNQVDVAPAGNAHRAGKEQSDRAGKEQCRAGKEQPGRPAATETDETTALLIRARSYLERGWCRNKLALDAEGNDVDPTGELAISWCAYGAVLAAQGTLLSISASVAPRIRLEGVMGGPIGNFNDAQETVEPVLAAFDRAIAASSPVEGL